MLCARAFISVIQLLSRCNCNMQLRFGVEQIEQWSKAIEKWILVFYMNNVHHFEELCRDIL